MAIDKNILSSNILYFLIDILREQNKSKFTEVFNILPNLVKNVINNPVIKNNDSKTNEYSENLSYEKRIELVQCDKKIKSKVLIKLKEFNNSKNGDSNGKVQHYIDGFLNIPFNIYQNIFVRDQFTIVREKTIYYNNLLLKNIFFKKNYSDLHKKLKNNSSIYLENNINPFNLSIFHLNYSNMLKEFKNIFLPIKNYFVISQEELIKKKILELKDYCEALNISNGNKKLLKKSLIVIYQFQI